MYKLEITTQIGCKVNCNYCPQDKILKNYNSDIKILTEQNFEIILSKLPSNTRIHFSGFCEPFLNKNCFDLVEMANKKFEIVLYTTLFGLDKKDIHRFGKIDFFDFVVHVPNSQKLNKNNINNWLNILIDVLGYNQQLKLIVIDDIDNYLYDAIEALGLPTMRQPSISRAGNLFDGKQLKGKLYCSENRLYQNVLLPNGDIVLCCQDYSLRHKIGNLLIDDFDSLHKSKAFTDMIKQMQSEMEDYTILCRSCEKAKIIN